MTTINLYSADIADHSHDDTTALKWANGFVFGECESSKLEVNTTGWRKVGTTDDGCVTVWHDGCESYQFEAIEPKAGAIASRIASLKSTAPCTRRVGRERWTEFDQSERYEIDFADDFEGWAQYDTSQDAPYFGVWVHRADRSVLTYAEGDWSLETFANDATYCAEIYRLNAFYGAGFIAVTIDEFGESSAMRQDRAEFTR